jgi:hypothetical protein
MSTYRALFACALAVMIQRPGFAQDAAVLAQGKAFAQSIAPTAPGQIVNPSGVNATAWSSGSVTVPSTMPSGLGTFSAPVTSSPLYQTSGPQGALSALGNAKMQACRNYVQTGDPMADQECAAVKFLDKDCVVLNTSQLQVVGAAGASAGAPVGCTDTFGAGQSNFGYGNAITTSDPVFQLSNSAQTHAAGSTQQNCTSTPVITTPAQYQTNTCMKSVTTDSHTCTQELGVAVTVSYSPADLRYSCSSGNLQGTSCVSTNSTPATANYSCTSGQLSGSQCLSSSSYGATLSYSCPNGGTLSGSSCVGEQTVPAQSYYTCATGVANGSTCFVQTSPTYSQCPPNWWILIAPAGAENLCTDGNHMMRPGTWMACANGSTPTNGQCNTAVGPATLNWQCNEGTLSGNSCIVQGSSPAAETYSCPNGGNVNGSSCISTSSTPANATYSCPNGGTLNGTQCVTSSATSATPYYACPGGITPVNNQCKNVLVQTQWNDNCLPYEQSAGSHLGAP